MGIPFNKYHGLGNDFIIIEACIDVDYGSLAKKICDRRLGLGADGMIVVKREPLEMVFYNQDGTLGTMCGNGLRCFAQYIVDCGVMNTNNYNVQTGNGIYEINIVEDNIRIAMGKPNYATQLLHMDTNKSEYINEKLLDVRISAVFMGTIHGVVFVDDLDEIITTDLGERLHCHPIFKEKANINFVEIVDSKNFKVATFERGVGWTLACGTGACASFAIAKRLKMCDDVVNIHFKHGVLIIESDKQGNIIMTGPATYIAQGIY